MFEKRKDHSSGYGRSCKECRQRPNYQKEYRIKNGITKPKLKKICPNCHKEFETGNAKQIRCNSQCMPEKRALLSPEEKKIRRRLSVKKCNEANKDKYRATARIKYENRTEEQKLIDRINKQAYKNDRMQRDIDYKLKKRLSDKVRTTINGNKQYNHSIELLGCTITEAREHIERQFKPGMTWDNWGVFGWHLDHIIPISSFDFTKKEDQYRCFHYTNLQPLWWLDNVMKADKIVEMQLELI
jgi:hypothetical protein